MYSTRIATQALCSGTAAIQRPSSRQQRACSTAAPTAHLAAAHPQQQQAFGASARATTAAGRRKATIAGAALYGAETATPPESYLTLVRAPSLHRPFP